MKRLVKKFWRRDDGVAAIEAALLIPIMLTMFLGTYDVGTAILANQKAVTASQVTADLIARNRNVCDTEINEAIEAARLAMLPYSNNNFGIDVVSIRFDEDSNPVVLWRETVGMSANDDAVASTAGFAAEGEGMVLVTVQYNYTPLFARFLASNIPMEEMAFVRGRRSPTVGYSC